ncbi:MAG: hypothetical protein AB7V42_13550 [Thermoleophilia bacterium]
MTDRERHALLLAARLLESGVPIGGTLPATDAGHLNLGLVLTERLQRVASGPEAAREIAQSLRRAAGPAAD